METDMETWTWRYGHAWNGDMDMETWNWRHSHGHGKGIDMVMRRFVLLYKEDQINFVPLYRIMKIWNFLHDIMRNMRNYIKVFFFNFPGNSVKFNANFDVVWKYLSTKF